MPIQKVLIPLDGSKFSEEALLTVPFLQSLGIDKVQLVTISEDVPGSRVPDAEYQEFLQKREAAGGAYLRTKAENVTAGNIEAHYVVRFGLAAEEIVREAEDVGADFIVLATHGRTGPERWSLGSVADKVVRLSKIPVLVIGPNVKVSLAGYRPHRIMVPLDGSDMSEVALTPARHIAELTGAAVHIVRVVPLPDRWLNPFAPTDPLAGMAELELDAQRYLAKVDAPAGTQRAVLRAGFISNVSNELIRYCGNTGIDLVVITSHTRAGASRLLLGGIADDLLRGPAPVLILKPGEARSSSLFTPAGGGATA